VGFATDYHQRLVVCGGVSRRVRHLDCGPRRAILRRTTSLATVSLPTPKLPPLLRGGSKVKIEDPEGDPDDIPRAVRPQLKPQKP